MKAVLLVGGEGTRLRPLTYDLPKPLFPVVNIPYLERLVAYLKQFQVDELILTACYLSPQIEAFCRRGGELGMKCTYLLEKSPLGTGGAVGNAANRLASTFLVFNGDILTDFDLGALVRFHRDKRSSLSLALVSVENPSRYGVAELAPEGRILRFVEKPPREEAPSNLINAGMYVMEPGILKLVPPDRKVSIERDVFPRVAEAGGLHGFVQDAYWLDMGTPADYLQAHFDFLDKKIHLDTSASFDRNIWVGKNAEIASGAEIISPVFIGENCRIEPGAAVGPHAVIGNDCRVGQGSKIENSVLWNSVKVEPNARVSGSIIGRGASVGTGALLQGEIVRSEAGQRAEGLLF